MSGDNAKRLFFTGFVARVVFRSKLLRDVAALIAMLAAFAAISFGSGTLVHGQSTRVPSAERSPSDRHDTSPGRGFQEIKREVEILSRRAAQAEDLHEKLPCIVDLCLLYYEVVSDRRYPTSPTLQGYTNRINHRLRQMRQSLQRQTRQESGSRGAVKRRDVPSVHQLAQDSQDQLRWEMALADAADQRMVAGYLQTGPQRWLNLAGGNFGPLTVPHAEELIDLIESVLQPDFWESGGGVGTVRYWSQSMVLVVRATTRMHEDLEQFLMMLRRSR